MAAATMAANLLLGTRHMHLAMRAMRHPQR
jgi:hypothetical protein